MFTHYAAQQNNQNAQNIILDPYLNSITKSGRLILNLQNICHILD